MNYSLKSTAYRISLFHLLFGGIAGLVIWLFPPVLEYLPVGAVNRLFVVPEFLEIESTTMHAGRLEGETVASYFLFFVLCFLSSVVLAIPLAWVYLATHQGHKINPSIAKALIVLPIAVTGLVLIVQNSLALAFSLAGIVAGAGIRFRTNLKEFTDVMYFLMSIGVGLASGVGSLGLAWVMSLIFCYTLLAVTGLKFGECITDNPEIGSLGN